MQSENVIQVKDVSIQFRLYKEQVNSLKEYMIRKMTRKLQYENFWALKNVSFDVKKGEAVAIVGKNGSGKSTMLKIVSGVMQPTFGTLDIRGTIAPMIELGAGFDMQYTGKENIYLYGAVLGYSRKFMDEKVNDIIEFTELKNFIDVPLKNYSSGMKARLGFAIATVVKPDILILDEVLSVGDAKFRKKSEKKLLDMMDTGTTVLFVSHNIEQVKRICDKALILNHGSLVTYGDMEDVVAKYEEMIK